MFLELTETAAMSDPVFSLDLLPRLRLFGFQLSIDDFGTCYSSILQLVTVLLTKNRQTFRYECRDKQGVAVSD